MSIESKPTLKQTWETRDLNRVNVQNTPQAVTATANKPVANTTTAQALKPYKAATAAKPTTALNKGNQ